MLVLGTGAKRGVGKGKIEELVLEADDCGHWTAQVTAKGKGILTLTEGNDTVAEWEIDGKADVSVSGTAAPEQTVRVVVQVGRGEPVEKSVEIPMMATTWQITPEDALVAEHKEIRFNVRVSTLCEVTRLTFDAAIRQTGVVREGQFLGLGDGWFVAPGESKGVYDIDVVLREAGVVLSRRSIFYEVGDVDQDRDGHKNPRAGGKDCDEGDPSVFPGATELNNGKDDDCDGMIDE